MLVLIVYIILFLWTYQFKEEAKGKSRLEVLNGMLVVDYFVVFIIFLFAKNCFTDKIRLYSGKNIKWLFTVGSFAVLSFCVAAYKINIIDIYAASPC